MKTLYSEKDNAELSSLLNSISHPVKETDEIYFEESDAIISKPFPKSNSLNALVSSATEEPKPYDKNKTMFSTRKGNISFDLDDSIFIPTKLAQLAGKRFEKKYTEQLSKLIFNDDNSFNKNNLLTLCYLTDLIVNEQIPIVIKTNKYKSILSKIVYCMNDFFKTNHSVVFTIYTMFKGSSSFRRQETENSNGD